MLGYYFLKFRYLHLYIPIHVWSEIFECWKWKQENISFICCLVWENRWKKLRSWNISHYQFTITPSLIKKCTSFVKERMQQLNIVSLTVQLYTRWTRRMKEVLMNIVRKYMIRCRFDIGVTERTCLLLNLAISNSISWASVSRKYSINSVSVSGTTRDWIQNTISHISIQSSNITQIVILLYPSLCIINELAISQINFNIVVKQTFCVLLQSTLCLCSTKTVRVSGNKKGKHFIRAKLH